MAIAIVLLVGAVVVAVWAERKAQKAAAVDDEMMAFRRAHGAVMLDKDHPEHRRRVDEWLAMFEARYG